MIHKSLNYYDDPNGICGVYRAAIFVDKILKGTKPADLPVEQPMKFEFVNNLNAANQIGLTSERAAPKNFGFTRTPHYGGSDEPIFFA
jgi:hypothetical protein